MSGNGGSRPSSEASIETAYGWAVVVASVLLMTVGTAGFYITVVALKPIAAEFGWPRWVPSAAYSVSLLGTGFGGIWMGRWSDRIGMMWPTIAGALAVVLGSFLAAQADNRWSYLAIHAILIGFFGGGAMFSPLVANVTRWFDRHRGIAVSAVVSGQGLAGAIFAPAFRWSVENEGWRSTFEIYAVFCLVTLIPLALVLRPRPPVDAADAATINGSAGDDGLVLGHSPARVAWILNFAIIGCCVAMAMPMVHVVAHASDLGHSTTDAAAMLSLLLGCGFVSRLVWGNVTDRIGGLPTLVLGSICQASALTLFLFVDSLIGLYLISGFFGLAFAGIVPSYTVILRRHFPVSQMGARVGVVYLFGTIGMAGGGYLGGVIFDYAGTYQVAFLVGLAFNIFNLILVAPLFGRERRADLARA
jgi:MFS family permease